MGHCVKTALEHIRLAQKKLHSVAPATENAPHSSVHPEPPVQSQQPCPRAERGTAAMSATRTRVASCVRHGATKSALPTRSAIPRPEDAIPDPSQETERRVKVPARMARAIRGLRKPTRSKDVGGHCPRRAAPTRSTSRHRWRTPRLRRRRQREVLVRETYSIPSFLQQPRTPSERAPFPSNAPPASDGRRTRR